MGKIRFIARSVSNKERLLNVAKSATMYVDLGWHITFPRGAKQGILSVHNFLCKDGAQFDTNTQLPCKEGHMHCVTCFQSTG